MRVLGSALGRAWDDKSKGIFNQTNKINAAEERQVSGQGGPRQGINKRWLKDTCQLPLEMMPREIQSGTEE